MNGSSTHLAPDGLSWATAFTQVQTGIDAAREGDAVWVAAGTYPGLVELKAGVALYGGFDGTETQLDQRDWARHVTILDGQRTNRVLRVAAGATHTTRIDGFTIQNGVTSGRGGGILCSNASPVIVHNLIRTNQASQGGGVYATNSFVRIESTTILDNVGSDKGGGIFLDFAAARVEGSTIASNRAGYGSGIYCGRPFSPDDSRATVLTNNLILANRTESSGGGVAADNADLWIQRNRILRNQAEVSGGGIAAYRSQLRLERNVVAGNQLNSTATDRSRIGGAGVELLGVGATGSAQVENNVFLANLHRGKNCEGGGLWNEQPASVIQNNTLLGNYAAKGGGIYDGGRGATFLNNLIAYGRSGVFLVAGSVFSNNCLHANSLGDYAGRNLAGLQGNFSADPRLTGDFSHGEFHLAPDSPCRDAGTGDAASLGSLDFDGQPRVQGPAADIGAHESDGAILQIPPHVIRVSPEGDDAADGLAWSTAKRTVQAALEAAAVPGGEVWVQTGTYFENLRLPALAHLYGGFRGTETHREDRDWREHPTILDGGRLGTVVDGCAGEGAFDGGRLCTVDGFVVQNGWGQGGGGGVSLKETLAADIRNNVVRWNHGLRDTSGAGGLYLYGDRLRVVGNAIVSNVSTSSAAGVCLWGTFELRHNLIADNAASTNARLNRTFTPAGGLNCCTNSVGQILNNTLVANQSVTPDAGGIVLDHATVEMANNLVAFCTSGLRVLGNPPRLRHNCVFANGQRDFSGVDDPTGIDGNRSLDPRLVATNGFHLLPDSPCVDAGDSALVDPDERDLDREPRMMGSQVDIGADEVVLPGVWQQAIRPQDLLRLTATNVGGILYGCFEVTLPDSGYRLLGVGPVVRRGADCLRDFRLVQQTGATTLPVATPVRGYFLLDPVASGPHTLTAQAWGSPVLSTPFTRTPEATRTLISETASAPGGLAFNTLGVPDVRYVVEASEDLTHWSGVMTNTGGPFEFIDVGTTNSVRRFYRVGIGP